MKAIPELKTSHFNISKFLLNETLLGTGLVVYSLSLFGVVIVLLPLSQSYFLMQSDASLNTSSVLYTVGMAIMGFGFLFASVAFLFFFLQFSRAVKSRMEAIQESSLSEEKEEYEILCMTVSKLNRLSFTAVVITPYFALFTLLLAFDSTFFTNIPLSQAFMILTIIINDTPGFLLPVNIFVV